MKKSIIKWGNQEASSDESEDDISIVNMHQYIKLLMPALDLLVEFHSKIKKSRKRSKSARSDDEGFESPTSPIIGVDPGGVAYSPGHGPIQSNGHVMYASTQSNFRSNIIAPLANQEDLEEEEKHSLELTKEQTSLNTKPSALATTSALAAASVASVASTSSTPQLSAEEKKRMLRMYPYFRLEVHLLQGKNLIAMDRGGVSDPYVRCLHGQDKLFQSRAMPKTVNPSWDETFDVHIDNPFKAITLQVFDKDLVGSDDFMGEATVDLTEMNLLKTEDFLLPLTDANNEDLIKKNKKKKTLGSIHLKVTMSPITKEEMNEFILTSEEFAKESAVKRFSVVSRGDRNSGDSLKLSMSPADGEGEKFIQPDLQRILRHSKTGKSLSWSALVHVVLIQARGLMAMDAGDSSDPYCKIALGKERQKSKVIPCTLNPKWREGFDLYWQEDTDDQMEITIWDRDVGAKDDFIGIVKLDLTTLSREATHNIWSEVQEGKGLLNFLVTITATTRGDSPSNLNNWEEELDRDKSLWMEKYQPSQTFKAIKDVGHLMVKVFKAKGLNSADIGGKSDPFAVVELCNDRCVTNTEYKTLTPTWQKVFQFHVKDIHDVLEITVYDEDKDHKYEFLGKVSIPLLKIKNNEKRWFALKDKKLRIPAKGDSPQILLEMFFVYNKVRAGIRTFNPKQLKYEDRSDIKFKQSVFMQNVNRVKAATAGFDPEIAIKEIQCILNWENKPKSAGAFVGFLLGVYFVEPWMITLGLLIPFIKNILVMGVTGGNGQGINEEYSLLEEEEEEKSGSGNKSDNEKEIEKKSLKEKMQAMQEITLMVQNGLGFLAHVLESVANVFNFCVPFLSWLAFLVLFFVTIILYFIPLRYLIMAWGTNKFTKKLLKPNAIANNELADFISRVPDNEELKSYRELPTPEEYESKTGNNRKSSSKKKSSFDEDII